MKVRRVPLVHAARMAVLLGLSLAPLRLGAVCLGPPNGIQEGPEECDASDLGGNRCEELCFEGGSLACNANCTFNTAGCFRCGDGIRQGDEVCDGNDVGTASCAHGGTLACQDHCLSYDYGGCWGCGNGVIELGNSEECDGGAVGGAVCNQPGEHGGYVSCHLAGTPSECQLDGSTCWRCGNGQPEGWEKCDDGNANQNDGCTTGCLTTCGNGTREGYEGCDDGNTRSGDGCSNFCMIEAFWSGGGNDGSSDCYLVWSAQGGGASGSVSCRDGNSACDADAVVGICTFNVSHCFFVGGVPSTCIVDGLEDNLAQLELTEGTTLDPEDQLAFLDTVTQQIEGLGIGYDVRHLPPDPLLAVIPPFTPISFFCENTFLHVPVGEQRQLAVRVMSAIGETDEDTLSLSCTN